MGTVTFNCGGCGKEIQAPADGAGKTGKCPFCGYGNVIPDASDDEGGELIPLAPLDPEEEQRRRREVDALLAAERDLLLDDTGEQPVPLEHRENLENADLHHFVINYCLDMAAGNLERAKLHVEKLKGFGQPGVGAVDDFLLDEIPEPALKDIPVPLLRGFLKQLRTDVTD